MTFTNPFVGKTKASQDYWYKLLFKQRVDRLRDCGTSQFEAEMEVRKELEELLNEAKTITEAKQ